MKRFLRYLRIAFSAVCGIACVLLIVLWVRSYWRLDVITAPGDGQRRLGSEKGWVTIRWKEIRPMPALTFKTWQFVTQSIEEQEKRYARSQVVKTRPPRFGLVDAGAAQFPYCLPLMVCVGISVAPWIRWRFSLRTLLIATALFAVGIGLFLWLAR